MKRITQGALYRVGVSRNFTIAVRTFSPVSNTGTPYRDGKREREERGREEGDRERQTERLRETETQRRRERDITSHRARTIPLHETTHSSRAQAITKMIRIAEVRNRQKTQLGRVRDSARQRQKRETER